MAFITLRVNSADDKWMKYLLLYQKRGFDISCKLSPVETIHEKRKLTFGINISKCRLLQLFSIIVSDKNNQQVGALFILKRNPKIFNKSTTKRPTQVLNFEPLFMLNKLTSHTHLFSAN